MRSDGGGLVYPVPKGWQCRTVNDIKSAERNSCVAGPFGSEIASRYFSDDGVPVIRGCNLTADLSRFVADGFVFVSEERAQQYVPQHVRAGDLVFTCWGTVGQVGLIPQDGPYDEYIISNKQLKLRVNPEIADPEFCFYYFASPKFVDHIKSRGIGGAVPGINLGILKSLRIALPPKAVQRSIAAFLNAFDAQIDNNRRRIKLLEDSVRLLFDEWFARLRFPGHELAAAVDGVPVGWTREPLGGSVVLRYGKALKAEDRSADGDVPVYGSSGVVGTHDKPMVTGPAIIVGRKGNVGSVFWCARDFWPIDTVYFVDAPTSDLYLYYALRNMHFISTDVAVPGLNRDLAYSRPLLSPPAELRARFLEVAGPIHLQIDMLAAISVKLRTARDLLLPRLMSGELTV